MQTLGRRGFCFGVQCLYCGRIFMNLCVSSSAREKTSNWRVEPYIVDNGGVFAESQYCYLICVDSSIYKEVFYVSVKFHIYIIRVIEISIQGQCLYPDFLYHNLIQSGVVYARLFLPIRSPHHLISYQT